MGAGGASRGVILPLLQQQPALLAVANRTPRKAFDLQQQFATYSQISAGGYMDFAGEQFDIVINATAASLNDDLPELPEGIFAARALAYDMMYSNKPTRFLQYAAQRGVPHLADGIGMLVEQAAESFYLWRDIRPDTRAVIAQLRNSRN
jgi:shikimate dehydrogenase